jgi:hypothetical protein
MSKRRFVLIIAIARYPDKRMHLSGVERDARRLWWALENYADGGVYRVSWLSSSFALLAMVSHFCVDA